MFEGNVGYHPEAIHHSGPVTSQIQTLLEEIIELTKTAELGSDDGNENY